MRRAPEGRVLTSLNPISSLSFYQSPASGLSCVPSFPWRMGRDGTGRDGGGAVFPSEAVVVVVDTLPAAPRAVRTLPCRNLIPLHVNNNNNNSSSSSKVTAHPEKMDELFAFTVVGMCGGRWRRS